MQSPADRSSRKPTSLRSRIFLVTFGVVLGATLAEILLAISGVVSLSPYEQDRIIGARLKANYAGWQSKEGHVFIRTNKDGFRDREHSLEKPANTFRIAVLGDSYCEAMQVELEQAFWSVMERSLKDCMPEKSKIVEVINTGVSGYGTAQEYLTLQHRVWDYKPDLILLCVLPANDIRNNSKSLEADQNRPFYRLEQDQLVLDKTFLETPLFASPWVRMKDQLVSKSHLGALLYRWRHGEESTPIQPGTEAGLDQFIYDVPQEVAHVEAWRITELLLHEIERETRRHHATLVIATIASGIQVHPDASTRQAFAAKIGVADLEYAERRIHEVADELGCLSITLAEPMRSYAEINNRCLHGFANTRLGSGHWNVEGHRVAGEIIAQTLCETNSFVKRLAP